MALPLRVTVSPDRVDANAGDVLTLDVTVRNTSDIVEHYVIDTVGLPQGASARTEPEVTKLRPGETGNATVRLTVQQQPPPEAGVYTLGVVVHSRYRDEISRCEELPLTVAPVENVALRIAPEVATGGRSASYTVQVANEGNTRVRLRLSSTDPERRVVSSFQPPELDLWPGAVGQSLLTVRAPVPWSKEKQRVLRIDATGMGVAGGGTATFVQRPRFASKLTRVAGVLGSTAVLAAAVVAAAVILKPDDKPTTNPTPGTNVDAQTPAATAGGPSAAASPSGAAASPTGPASPTGGTQASPTAVAAVPQDVDLTRPNGQPGDGVIASDAFRTQGITLSGLPDTDGPAECATATATAIRGETGARFLTAALPDNPAACNFVPVQIRFVNPASSVEVVLGGQGKRRMEVFYRDLSRSISDNLKASDDGRHGGIDFVLIRGLPADVTNEPPPAAVRKLRFTPAAR